MIVAAVKFFLEIKVRRACWCGAPSGIYQTTLSPTVSQHFIANSPITNHYPFNRSLLVRDLHAQRCVHVTKLCKR